MCQLILPQQIPICYHHKMYLSVFFLSNYNNKLVKYPDCNAILLKTLESKLCKMAN